MYYLDSRTSAGSATCSSYQCSPLNAIKGCLSTLCCLVAAVHTIDWSWWWLTAWPGLHRHLPLKVLAPTIKRPQWPDSGSIYVSFYMKYFIICSYCLYLIAPVFFSFFITELFYFSCFSCFISLFRRLLACHNVNRNWSQLELRRIAGVLYVYNPTGAWAPWAQYMSGVYT